jgi:hypothetical protein
MSNLHYIAGDVSGNPDAVVYRTKTGHWNANLDQAQPHTFSKAGDLVRRYRSQDVRGVPGNVRNVRAVSIPDAVAGRRC